MPKAPTHWHALPLDEVLERLGTKSIGLSGQAAEERRAEYGYNELPSAPPRSAIRILIDQLRSVIVLLLIAAAVVSLVAGDIIDAAAIGAVLLINATIGFITEFRARRAMHALLRLDVPRATVVRNDAREDIDARLLVPGDVIELEAGQGVPADARLISATEVTTNEAALTGESMPVSKQANVALAADTPLPERTVMVYKSTAVATGHARAVVVATGSRTEVGKIGELVAGVEEGRTHLERRLDQLGHSLIWVTLLAVAAVTVVGLLRGEALGHMVKLGISLAVAAVPEGLVAIATITMAVGVRRMARRHATIRRLPVVETLGAVTTICTDKTGTLTTGVMTATVLWTSGRDHDISREALASTQSNPAVVLALRIGALANRSDIIDDGDDMSVRGDPTEVALIVAARRAGLSREALLREVPEVGEIPFSSERKLMATFHRSPDGSLLAKVKGAPGRLLELSDRMLSGDKEIGMTGAMRAELRRTNDALAARGLRVLALATGTVAEPSEQAVRGLVFVGFVGMIDPPAPGVKETISSFREAGIRTVMLTGDQRLTAVAIGRELGILEHETEAMDGRELATLSDEAFAERLEGIRAVSRLSPADKLRIVHAFQSRKAIVAMLGDGVNDAPALKAADVGVAMGGRGTDVAKEAASVVLQDDRFATIGAAIEEGRVIHANIRKFIFYLFSCNVAEVMVLLVAGVVGLPIPLLPLQILWLNLVTDTFPALALALEPGDPDVMRRPPRDPATALLSRRMVGAIGAYGAMITAVTLIAFVWALSSGENTGRAETMAFLTLALAQIFHLGNARSSTAVTHPGAIIRNRWALGAVAFTISLQVIALYFPPLARVLGTVPLGVRDWVVALVLGAVPAVIGQGIKLRREARDARAARAP